MRDCSDCAKFANLLTDQAKKIKILDAALGEIILSSVSVADDSSEGEEVQAMRDIAAEALAVVGGDILDVFKPLPQEEAVAIAPFLP